MVGNVLMYWPNLSRYNAVVLPAESRPTIVICSVWKNGKDSMNDCSRLENVAPILAGQIASNFNFKNKQLPGEKEDERIKGLPHDWKDSECVSQVDTLSPITIGPIGNRLFSCLGRSVVVNHSKSVRQDV